MFGLKKKASMVGFTLLSRSYYYLRRRSPGPPFPPDHRQAGERGAIIADMHIDLPTSEEAYRDITRIGADSNRNSSWDQSRHRDRPSSWPWPFPCSRWSLAQVFGPSKASVQCCTIRPTGKHGCKRGHRDALSEILPTA